MIYEAHMTTATDKVCPIELVLEGQYTAAVELIETDSDGSPYFSLSNAEKLDDMRSALRRGQLTAASKLGTICQLTPVAAG